MISPPLSSRGKREAGSAPSVGGVSEATVDTAELRSPWTEGCVCAKKFRPAALFLLLISVWLRVKFAAWRPSARPPDATREGAKRDCECRISVQFVDARARMLKVYTRWDSTHFGSPKKETLYLSCETKATNRHAGNENLSDLGDTPNKSSVPRVHTRVILQCMRESLVTTRRAVKCERSRSGSRSGRQACLR
jgi:hypothetical protein